MNLGDDKAFRREHAVLIEKLAANITSLGHGIDPARARDSATSQLKAITRIKALSMGLKNPDAMTAHDIERFLLNTYGYEHALEFMSALHSADKKKRVELQKRFFKHKNASSNTLPLWQQAIAGFWCVQVTPNIPPACLLSAVAIDKIFNLGVDLSAIRHAIRRDPLRLVRPADFVFSVSERFDLDNLDKFWLQKVNSRLS